MLVRPLTIEKSQILFNRNFLNTFVKKKSLKLNSKPLSNAALSSCVRINFITNNIYYTFWSISGKQTFRTRSTGTQKIKSSKKRLFFIGKLFLEFCFKELQQWRQLYKKKDSSLFFRIKIPKRFRKIVLNYIAKKTAVINFEYSKAFNGCKAKKKRRKKRLGFRSFK